jgi:hypothetical protein
MNNLHDWQFMGLGPPPYWDRGKPERIWQCSQCFMRLEVRHENKLPPTFRAKKCPCDEQLIKNTNKILYHVMCT